MFQFVTDTVEPFRPEWTRDNVINGRLRKNPNDTPRERTIGIYEDEYTGEVYVSSTIRSIRDYPNGRIAKKVVKGRIRNLMQLRAAAEENRTDVPYCIPYVAVYSSREEARDYLTRDDCIDSSYLRGKVDANLLDRAFEKLDKRVQNARKRHQQRVTTEV